ncbi:LuxR C-terminal-related transcriptional regulator [Streptomyces sp. NPDC005017]|uniref:response regulator transcription factor n=1 Tax=Streptomyces sp. NPDC005017 TaxID=3364706 RepID=UPI0036C7CB16
MTALHRGSPLTPSVRLAPVRRQDDHEVRIPVALCLPRTLATQRVRDRLSALRDVEVVLDEPRHTALAGELTTWQQPIVLLVPPVAHAAEAVREVSAPGCRTVVLVADRAPRPAFEMIAAGARGVLDLHHAADELTTAIHAVAGGHGYVSPSVTGRMMDLLAGGSATSAMARSGAEAQLTRREREVLRLLAEGRSNAEIAQLMSVTTSTVKYHVSNVLAKLGLRRRGEAIAYALGLPVMVA